MSNTTTIPVAAAMAVFAMALPALAQTNRIGGVVKDETGGHIRGAIVRGTSGGTGTTSAPMSMTTATDDRGRFVFVVNRSGEWRISFEAPGFEPANISVVMRLTGFAPNLDIRLQRREEPEAFGALAGVDSKSLSAQLAAASALLDDRRYDQAIAAYRDIKAKAPALTLVNLQIGNAYLEKKSYPEAHAAFQEILKDDPEDASALFAMGALREAEGNAGESATWYQKAAAADVFWTRPLMKLATFASASGDKAAVGRYLTRVIDLDPASPDAKQAAEMLSRTQ